ncbi:uncharacterized protein LOC124157815 [Ischnura elegans]|uniref:uncharacterized protein LOC124157815 n=1 Tax=Ischnura elegans TaxID=197161 RepID=UPI001ED8A218|nr:uncharacterized protein LOC124157815 [Ischnura elegans]
MSNHKLMYTFRGWIAFVAFMDVGTAVRCYIEKRTFLGDGLFMPEDSSLPRILGAYAVLKSLILIHCTLFIHYRPIISLGVCSLLLTILLYLSESLYFGTAVFGFYVLFPCVLNALTMVGLMITPRFLDPPEVIEDENTELLRQAVAFRRRRGKKIN